MRVSAAIVLASVIVSGCATPTPAATTDLQARSGTLPAWIAGQGGRAAIDITGGTLPYTCALAPGSALPQGLQLEGCNVTGTAPLLAPGSSKSLSPPFAVDVTDSAAPPAAVRAVLQIAIEMPAPRVAAVGGTCTVGVACVIPMATVENAQTPYSLTAFPHPDGLAFDGTTGVMSGMPTRAGVFPIEVCVNDLVGERECANAVVTILAAGGDDEEDAPDAPTPTPPTPTPEPPDTTPLGVTLYYTTCVVKPDGSSWEIRASGVASGRVGSSLSVRIESVSGAPAPATPGILMESDWRLLAGDRDPPDDEAWAPVPQRERGDVGEGSWSMTNALVPIGERDLEYRIYASALSLDPDEATVFEEETVRCYAPPVPRSLNIFEPSCSLVSRTERQSGGSAPEYVWTWTIALSGNATGRVDDRLSVSLAQPYVIMDKTGGAWGGSWTGSPTSNVNRNAASWAVTRAASDARTIDWTVSSLTVTDWEYISLSGDYDPTFTIRAQLYQDTKSRTLTCPK